MTQAPATARQTALERFKELMRELLQLDLADLDFGIYRLLNARRSEVEAFLSEELPTKVDEAFAGMTDAGREAAAAEAERLAQRAREALGEDAFLAGDQPNPAYVATPSMRAYVTAREHLDGITATDEQKAEVFNHLHAFLSRYYDAGDFIPHRRYGRHEAYAVPYNGEETLFHWVNRDQHYVKTGEQFRDHAFRVAGRDAEVRFSLASATTARDNTKGDTRYFFPLADEATWDAGASRLTVPFEYWPQLGGAFDRAVEESQGLLNSDGLERPSGYEIEVLTDDGPRTQKVDLVETFNLVHGVHVERIQVWTNEVDRRRYRAVSGHKDGHRLLILWRDMVEPPLDPQVERTFLEERIEPGAYDEVLINGDSAVPGITSLDPIFKRLIEEEDR